MKDELAGTYPNVKWFDEENNFLMPDYSSGSIANLPWSIVQALTGKKQKRTLDNNVFADIEIEKAEKIILVLVDGLGYIQNYAKLKETFYRNSSIEPITTVFPSTTAAALTSLNTGLTVQEHGLLEWYIYLEEVDDIIASLPFTPIGTKGRDTILDKVKPNVLFEGRTIHSILKSEGVQPYSLLGRGIATSSYSKLSHRGSKVLPCSSLSDMFVHLKRLIESSRDSSYYYLYWSMVDSMEHTYGPSFEASKFECDLFLYCLKNFFISKISKNATERVFLIVTADHGQIDINPENTYYLNRLRKLVTNFAISKGGRPIPPSGSARDVYLHTRDCEDMIDYLRKKIGHLGLVLEVESAFKQGLFGVGNKSKTLASRTGNIMILPYSNNTIWYRFERTEKLDLRGHHGGLTPGEVLIPLVVVDLNKFVQ